MIDWLIAAFKSGILFVLVTDDVRDAEDVRGIVAVVEVFEGTITGARVLADVVAAALAALPKLASLFSMKMPDRSMACLMSINDWFC